MINLIENLLYDANNFTETGSWYAYAISAESYTAPAPDGSLTAYNAVDSYNVLNSTIRQDFHYPQIANTTEQVVGGIFLKNTGVNSQVAMLLLVGSSNDWAALTTLTWSSNNTAVMSSSAIDSGHYSRLLPLNDGWWLAEISMPNSNYDSSIRWLVSVGGYAVGGAPVGAVSLWRPYLTTLSSLMKLDPLSNLTNQLKGVEKVHQMRDGGQYNYRFGESRQLKFGVNWLTSSQQTVINSWWGANTELLAFDDNGTFVMSAQLINKTLPITKRMRPHNNKFAGTIDLGTY